MQRIKFVCVSNKGGVGKTSVSTQILVPYLFSKGNKPIDFITIDDVNSTADTLEDTKIMNIHELASDDRESLVEFLNSAESCVFDIGGNKTANDIINEIGESEIVDDVWWVIPLGDGDEDVLNAIDTYQIIALNDASPKVMFALTKVMSHSEESYTKQFLYVFGHKYNKVKRTLWGAIGSHPYLIMPGIDNFNIGKSLKRTMYELGSDDYINSLREEKVVNAEAEKKHFAEKEEYDEGLKHESNRIGYNISTANKFKKYSELHLMAAFQKIDETLKMSGKKSKK